MEDKLEKEIIRVIKSMVEKGWITKNEHLTDEGLARGFIIEFMEMPLSSYINFINR